MPECFETIMDTRDKLFFLLNEYMSEKVNDSLTFFVRVQGKKMPQNTWHRGNSDYIKVDVCLIFSGYIQACRGLMIAAICLGFFGSIFALVGMKCTKIGGTDKNKARIACFAGVDFILSGRFNGSMEKMDQ